MPLSVRPVAITIAVVCFFGLSLVGWFSGLAPFICCKRALAGAAIAYIVTVLAVKAINAILINAMVTNKINKQREKRSGGAD